MKRHQKKGIMARRKRRWRRWRYGEQREVGEDGDQEEEEEEEEKDPRNSDADLVRTLLRRVKHPLQTHVLLASAGLGPFFFLKKNSLDPRSSRCLLGAQLSMALSCKKGLTIYT